MIASLAAFSAVNSEIVAAVIFGEGLIDFCFGGKIACIGLLNAFQDMLGLPFVSLQIKVDRLFEQFGAIAVEFSGDLLKGKGLAGVEVEGDGAHCCLT
jgi:hypothetical protein